MTGVDFVTAIQDPKEGFYTSLKIRFGCRLPGKHLFAALPVPLFWVGMHVCTSSS